MTKPTGRGRGRPKGSKNKRTREIEKATAEAAEKLSEQLGFQGDAHAFLMAVYKDESQDIALRMDAAKAAAPYEKPKLSSVEHRKPPIDISKLSDAELQFLDSLYERAGFAPTGESQDGDAPPAGVAGTGGAGTRH